MDISYRRSTGQNGLVMNGKCAGAYESFVMKMLLKNQLPFCVPVAFEGINNEIRLVYDISSKYSFSAVYEMKNIKGNDLQELIIALKAMSDIMDEYLLDPEMIVIDPDYIYLDPDGKNHYFCICPYEDADRHGWRKSLADFIISRIDYKDAALVRVAHQVSTAVKSDEFSIGELWMLVDISSDNEGAENIKKAFGKDMEKEVPDHTGLIREYDLANDEVSLVRQEKHENGLFGKIKEKALFLLAHIS